MKKVFVLFLLAVSGSLAFAQKYASVNTEYVLTNIPDYVQALARLNKYVQDWQKEIDGKQAEVDNLRANYLQEAYVLPENLKQRRQQDLKNKEVELKELQRQRFGVGGDLDKKRAELLKPIQDRIYDAIERIAMEKKYAFVFDRAGNNTVIFAESKYDISDLVLEQLGYSPGDADAEAARQQAENGNSGKQDAVAPKRSTGNPQMIRPR